MSTTSASPQTKSLNPGDTIGIIGGGQLGRMLAMAAARLGLRTITLEPSADCPAAQLSNSHIIAAYNDRNALQKLVDQCSVITYEFENIPLDAINFLEENNTLYPPPMALAKSQDRLIEKQFLNDIGVETAPYYSVDNINDLSLALEKCDDDAILKTRRMGYDGKGQVSISRNANRNELVRAFDTIGKVSAILEGMITFQREISVIIARSNIGNGNIQAFEPSENVHRDGILRTSTLPAQITDATRQNAISIAKTIVEALDYVGVMGVEFFVKKDGGLIVNEIAPRVHNSGHWTEAACTISQFEQHIRAISGWPLAAPDRHSDCIMENLIGDDMLQLPQLRRQSNIHIHLYGKTDIRAGRKMGHFTRIMPKTA